MDLDTIEKCDIIIAEYEKRINDFQENRISKAMKPYKTFFGTLKTRNRDQAIEFCKKEDNIYLNATAIVSGFQKYHNAQNKKKHLTFYQNSFYREGKLFIPTNTLFVLCAKWQKEHYNKAHFYIQDIFNEFYGSLRRSKEMTEVPDIVAHIIS